jgi:peptidyl-prolyl cis-trans isomerase SurA
MSISRTVLPAPLRKATLTTAMLATAILASLFLVCTTAHLLYAQQPNAALVLAKVGKESITYGTLEEAYRKNMNNRSASFAQLPADSAREFLHLYINYRLKVQDALGRGFDKKPEIQNDIKQNRASLAAPFLYERVLISPAVDSAFNRRKVQFKVALILSNVKQGDTAAAYKRSLALLDLVTKQGKDFAQVAKDSSDDEYSRGEGGVFPFVTANQMLKGIEDVVYRNLKPGEIHPKPIKTQIGAQPGYFIVKLLAIEPRVALLGRQILVSLANAATSDDTARARRRADSLANVVKTSVKSVEDFARLASTISDDKSTTETGGRFPSYYTTTTGYLNGLRYRLKPPVEKALFALKDGEISGVVQSELGFHILRRDSSKIGGDDREELKRFYKRFLFEADKQAFLDSVKKVRKFSIVKKTFDGFIKLVDTTKGFDSLQYRLVASKGKKLLNEPLFKVGDFAFTVQRFTDSLLGSAALRGYSMTREGVNASINKLVSSTVQESLTNSLEKDYPEFATLMREFQEGILIFRVEEQEIWSKLKFDSVRAKQYHEPIKGKFMTEAKYDFSEIFIKHDSAAKALHARLVKSPKQFDSLAAALTEREGYREKQGRWQPLAAWENLAVNAASKSTVGAVNAPVAYDGGFSITRLNAIIPPRVKTFEEAIPDFAAQFQDLMQREYTQQWLSGLRATYPVSLDEAAIDKVWKRSN